MRRRALTRPVRAVAAGAALLGLVLSATACNPGRPPAATVAGRDISAEDLDTLLAAYLEADPDTFQDRIEGAGEGTYQVGTASELLNSIVLQLVQSELADREGATPTPEERAEAEDLVRNGFSALATVEEGAEPTDEQMAAQDASSAAFDDLPEDLREWLVDLRADTLALARVAGPSEEERDAEAREIFEGDPSVYENTYCLRAIVVAGTDLPAVQERLAAGEDFGAVSAEVSIDPTVAGANGELGGCLPGDQLAAAGLNEQIVPLVQPLEVGDVSDTFDLGDGNVAIFERRAVTYEDVSEAILSTLPAGGEQALAQIVQESVGDVEVSIDPRFGTWDPETGRITPPDGAREPASEGSLPGEELPPSGDGADASGSSEG